MLLEGACLCGHVRYRCDAEPVVTLLCHCRNCQRSGGAPYSVDIGIPRASLVVNGDLASYNDKGDDSGQLVVRKFCPKCGSPIVSDVTATPDLLWLKAGSLFDSTWLKPQMNIWTERAQPWVCMDQTIPSFPRNPPMGE